MPEHPTQPKPPANAPLLSGEGLGRRIGDRWIWREMAFQALPRECLAVTGPSGSGKTLFLRCLSLLDPLDEGHLALDGKPALRWPPPTYRMHVLYVHQRPALVEGTVEENLRRVFALKARHRMPFDRERAASLLERLGRHPDMLAHRIEGLSGGEAQTVALVRALLVDASVLLLDEPTASLDEAATRRTESVLMDWKAARADRAMLWVSHNPEQLDRVADRRLSIGGAA